MRIPGNRLEASEVGLEANDIWSMRGGAVMSAHFLQMAPGLELVAKMMLRDADHSLAEEPILRVRPVRRQSPESLRHFKSGAMPPPGEIKRP